MERRQVLRFLAAAATSLWAAPRLSATTLLEPPARPQDSPAPDLLPLFPLELVLLPHVNLPLHIFEERYKEMIGDCLKNQWEFGILAVQGESVKPIGCTASITEVLQRFPDGRMNILTRGRRRFEVSDLNEDRSYLRGKPRFFDDDEEASSLGDLPNQAVELYDRLRKLVELENEVFHEPRTEFVMSFLGHTNRFPARVEQGKVRFATLAIEAPQCRSAPSGNALVFIRPHDLELSLMENGRPSLKAAIARIHSAGPMVRLELVADSGETFFADLPQERFRSLNVGQGGTVFAVPRDLKVFGGTNDVN